LKTQSSALSQARIFWFWLPLAAMWLIMSAEQPSITAIVSRLPDATRNLAAFGLTFSFALIVESPVIMLLTAATALATDRRSYRRLLRFTHALALSQTAIHLLLALTPLYAHILRDWVGAPEEIIETSRVAFLLMTPWTAMIAYRRLMEGIMIRYQHPQRVTQVIVLRLTATLVVLLAGLFLGRWPGAYVGGVGLSVGVTIGAFSAWWLARPTLRDELAEWQPGMEVLGWRRLLSFYVPLALTTLITMVSQPILAFGLSHAAQPLESLAIWPVVMSLLFIGRSPGIAYQEVVVALLTSDEHDYAQLRRYAFTLAISGSLIFVVLALTPGAAFWYRYAAGLDPALVNMALLPTLLVAPVPGLGALLSWQRGVLVHRRHTRPISTAVALNMLTLAALTALVLLIPSLPGALLAATALTLSLIVESLYLGWQLMQPGPRLIPVEAATGD
jgi:hypothetical protein